MSELWERGAFDLGTSIRDRVVSSREVVEAHLARIESVNPTVNAVTETLAGEALAAADEADAAIARGAPTSPFHGVPFTVKESIDVAGSPTTQGVTALAAVIPSLDAPAITNLRAAGGIPFARSGAPDLALRWHTDNDLHGPTRNPWDPARTPGGSSGGAPRGRDPRRDCTRLAARCPDHRPPLPRGPVPDRGVGGRTRP